MAAVDSSIPDVTPGAAPETVPDVVQPVEEVKPEEPKDAAPETNGTENCEPHAEDKVHSVNEATNETEEALGENGAEVGGEFIHEGEEPINFEAEAVTQQPQLDVHLAVIEEQFRKGFEERYSQPSVASQRQVGVNGWMYVWMDEWMDMWMDGWSDSLKAVGTSLVRQ